MKWQALTVRQVVYVAVAVSILAAVAGVLVLARDFANAFADSPSDPKCKDEIAPPPPPKSDPVPGGGVKMLALGGNTSCARMADHSIWCWGDGRGLQAWSSLLGLTLDKPTEILPASPRKNFLLGGFTRCEITAEDQARCTIRKAGPSADLDSEVIFDLPNTKHLVVGAHHACAIREHEQEGLWCWGANDSKQIIDSSSDLLAIPTRTAFAPSGSIENVAVGDAFTCARSLGQNAECWGSNRFGQLGGGVKDNSISHATVMQTESTVQLVAGNNHVCALSNDGHIRCWGANSFGQLGDGTTENRSSPVEVKGFDGPAQQIVASSNRTCALMATGMVYCWGAPLRCSPGYECDGLLVPARILDLNDIVDLSLGEHHACALHRDGSVACWGENDSRQVSARMPFRKEQVGRQKNCFPTIFVEEHGTDNPMPVIW